jgi:hypothetical protein
MLAQLDDSLGGSMLVRARRRGLRADVLNSGLEDAVASLRMNPVLSEGVHLAALATRQPDAVLAS